MIFITEDKVSPAYNKTKHTTLQEKYDGYSFYHIK